MTHPKFTIYLEETPEYYASDMSITVNCKPSERWKVEMLISVLESLEGFEFEAGGGGAEQDGESAAAQRKTTIPANTEPTRGAIAPGTPAGRGAGPPDGPLRRSAEQAQ